MFERLSRLRHTLTHPTVDEADIQRRLAELKLKLRPPVVWLLGKAQAGKTSIIQALTGDPRAMIGNGFEPCTRMAVRYAFPDKELPLLEFLDTQGLGDVRYDPTEDLRWLEDQAHLVMLVMRAMDHAQGRVLSVYREVRRRHPEWPVLVVQTCLHEGYPWREPRHILPYPFDQEPLPSSIPQDLARSLLTQRSWFVGEQVQFVAVDFTLPEDGFDPQFYGLEQLWEAIEEVFPFGLRGLLGGQKEVRRLLGEAYSPLVEDIVLVHAALAAAAGAIPIPGADLPLIMGIHVHLTQQLATLYGQSLTADRLWDIAGTLGWSYLTRWGVRYGIRELFKAVPWVGVPVAGAFMGFSTYALGHVLAWYFAEVKEGQLPGAKTIHQVYRQEFENARQRLAKFFDEGIVRLAGQAKNDTLTEGAAGDSP